MLVAKKESEDPLKGMQQAKSYADCERYEVKYVFATNGHRYGEYDLFTSLQEGPHPFADFLTHPDRWVKVAIARRKQTLEVRHRSPAPTPTGHSFLQRPTNSCVSKTW